MTRLIAFVFLSVLFPVQFSSPAHAQSDEAVFWQSISDSADPAEFCAYLEAFPEGKFATLAKLRVKKLGGTCSDAAAPAPAPVVRTEPVPAPAPAPTTPRPTTPPTTAEMEAAHKSLTAGEIAMTGFPRSTPPFSEFTIKQCFDCAEVQVICKDKTISGAHQLGGVKVAVMDWPTAGPTLGWVKQFNGFVLEVAPDSIFGAVNNGMADCAAFGGGMLRYGNWDKDQELAKLGQHLNVAPPAPAATAAPAPAPVAKKTQRTGVGRYWAYVPMPDDGKYVGRIEYRSEYFQGKPVAEIGVAHEGGEARLYWFIQDKVSEDFGAGTGEYDVNVFLSEYDEQDDSFPLDTMLMLRDKERGCDYKNLSFCGIKCGRNQGEFSYRGAGDCKEIAQPWYEFKAEMAERHWKNLLTPPARRTRLWLQPGGNNFYLATEGLVEAICDNVKGADKYCDDEVRRMASASVPARAQTQPTVSVEPLNELRYTGSASNVRNAPGTHGDKLLTLQEGQQVEVSGKVSGANWYRIKLAGGSDGYVHGDLLVAARPGGSGASAPVASAAPTSPAPPSSGGSGLPPISEANGPLCEFFGEGDGWKVSAGFDRVSVTSTDTRESFRTHNGFSANGVELGFTEYPDADGAREISIDIFNVEKGGEVIYDRLEGEYTKHKYIDGELTLSAGGATTTVSATSHVFEFFTGGSSIGFDLPGHWMIGKLRAGDEISIDVSLQGSRAVSMTINTDTFIDAFRHTTRARSKMADNLANGRCGFGAGSPTASSGILGCTSARDRAPGNVEGVRFAVIPGSQKDSIKDAVKDDPRGIEIFDASLPVFEVISNLGGYYEGVAFYDRDIRKRNHPIDGGPLVIGEMVNLPLFKQLAEQSSGAEFRCELLVAAEVCPHPKTPQASQPCN